MPEKTDKAKKSCFVVGPIGDPGSDTRNRADWLYEEIILPVLAEFSAFEKPIRADKIAQPGLIDAQVIRNLLDADLVIADLSELNANAFYEIGIRHMAQKPVIHMQSENDKVPFDVSLYRAIKFSLRHPESMRAARRELKAAVDLASRSEYRAENPVTHARAQIHIEQTASPEQKVFLDELRALRERVNRLETKRTRAKASLGRNEQEQFYIEIEETRSADKIIEAVNQTLMNLDIEGWSTEPRDHGILLRIFGRKFNGDEFSRLSTDIEQIDGVRSLEIPF